MNKKKRNKRPDKQKGKRRSNDKKPGIILTGTVDHVNHRYAFIVSEESEKDIKVDTIHLAGAVDGDTVKIKARAVDEKSSFKPEGKVIEIIERKRNKFVGRVETAKGFAFVIPDFRKIYSDIFVPENYVGKAKHGDKVIVKIKEWSKGSRNPVGIITDVLGKSGDNDAEMHSIMAEFDLPVKFPKDVLQAAASIPAEIAAEEIKKREDLRKVTTFTIDPDDAKDFDDALSIRKLENGNWEIGIHIADVSHYVTPDSVIEKEAYRRATSVYLVDRTVPMLPERLSNELCSLRPNEDKLTFSAVFELDENAEVKKRRFGRTVIHSDRRFSYEEAQAVLDKKEGDFADELEVLNRLAKKLQRKRFSNGSIAFETKEVKFKLDEKGFPTGVYIKERKDTHKLIEEFMLLANREVAEFIFNPGKSDGQRTMVYRIHDDPDPERVKNFALFARKFGYKIEEEGRALSKSLNQMAEDVQGKPEQNVLQTLAVRSMAKAKYTTKNSGHYGLAFDYYTHFTSPIRRYPDMMVHRLLQNYLNNGKSPDREKIEEECRHSSEREKLAADAERASIKYKQVEYMRAAADKVYDGVVSGVTDWGVFVELIENGCEGMVRVSDLTDDYYVLDAPNFRLVGQSNKRMITFGDKVKVSVTNTDLDRRTIDMEMVDF